MIIRVAPLYEVGENEASEEGKYAFDVLDLAFNRPLKLKENNTFEYFDLDSIRNKFHSRFSREFLARFTEEEVPGILGFGYRALEQKQYLGLSQEDSKLMEVLKNHKDESCTLKLEERHDLLKGYAETNAARKIREIHEETPWMINTGMIPVRKKGYRGTLDLEDVTIDIQRFEETRYKSTHRLSDYALSPWGKSDSI